MGSTNLVDHHHCKQIADGSEEKTIEIVLNTVTDGVAEDVQDDLTDDEEEDTKDDVTHRPAVLKCAENEDDLADKVDKQEDGVDNICDDKDADRVLSIQTGPVLEREEGDCATNDEHGKGGQSQQPDRECCSILVQLETHETVDQQAGAERGNKAVLHGGEVRVRSRSRRSDACVENEGDNGEEEVDVEERGYLLSAYICTSVLSLSVWKVVAQRTNSSEFGTDMYYHDHRHYQGQDVHEVVRCLEDESVRNLNCSRITLCLYASSTIDLLVAHKGAQRYRCLFA